MCFNMVKFMCVCCRRARLWIANPRYAGSSPVTHSTRIWADSDNGSTGALQAFSRGSIPRRSTKF